MDSKHKGANSELLVCSYFLKQGAEVFRNVSQHGPADLVVWFPDRDETIFIDVKTAIKYVKQDGSISLSCSKPTREDVRTILVVDDEVIGFSE